MPSELEELVEFLHAPQAPIRTVALENLVRFSQGSHQKIFYQDDYRPIKDLKVLARDKGKTIVQQALTILVNLCEDETVRELIVKDDLFLKHLISLILDIENRNADISTILLTNLAKHDEIKKIHDFEIPITNKDIYKSNKAIDCLLDVFVKGAERTLNKNANYDYLAYFFADYSRLLEGRKYFVTKQEYDDLYPITKILVFTEKYDSKTRREGVASTIKNSLFEIEAHNSLVTDDINILPYLLLPIATSKDAELDEEELFNLPDELQLLPPDKERDPSPEIICVHLESLLLLSTTRQLREILREKSVYPLVRELHKNIDNEDIQDLCDRLVQMLMRDEDPTQDDRIDEILEKKEELEKEDLQVEQLLVDDKLEEIEDSESDDNDEIMEVV